MIFVSVGAQLSKSYALVYEYYPHQSSESISLALLSFITSNFYSLPLPPHMYPHSRMHISSKNTCFICLCVVCLYVYILGFPSGSMVKNQPDNAGDVGLIPGSERSLEKEMATHSSILAWRNLWTDEPGGLQSIGSQKNRTQLSN